MTNAALPFKNAHPCTCGDCRCAVTVTSHHKVCRACRNGGHDLRSWKLIRVERRESQRTQAA
jgi:hypothetical protein